MRRTLSAVVVGALLLLGCGSDESTVETVETVDSTVVSAEAAPVSSTEPTTAATDAVESTVVPAALTPEAVCVGNNGEVYFGYDNASGEPVVVPEGASNQLSGVKVDDNPLLTTLFAPGTVDMAFWAFPVEGSSDDVVWTLTGPDGAERTASGGQSTEPCPSDFLSADASRVPTLEVVGQTLSADGQSADVELRLTGVAETSVCNEAFDAEPALVSISDGSTLPTAFEPEATVNIGPFRGAEGLVANTGVYALVLDQCSAAEATALSWWPPPQLSLLSFGTQVCVSLDAEGTVTAELTEGLCGLGATGGSSIRPK